MSSELDVSGDLRNFPQSSREDPEDTIATQSSILFLLQEATKLAAPSNQNSLDAEDLRDGSKQAIIQHSAASEEQKGHEVGNGFTGTFSVLSSSPWEVMSLINLQCERLLHSGDSSVEDKGTNAELNVEGRRASAEAKASACPRMEMGSACFSLPHTMDIERFANQLANEKGDNINTEDLAELMSRNTEDDPHSSGLSEENDDVVEPSMLPLDLSTKASASDQTDLNTGERDAKTLSGEGLHCPEIGLVDFTSSLVETDGDSRMCFAFDDAGSESMPYQTGPSQSRTDMNNNLEVDAQHGWGASRRTPRKQPHPVRSPDLQNPGVQGVTFSMHTELDHSTDQCRLLITSNYSELCRRGRRNRGSRSRSLQSSQRTSSSEEESDPASSSKKMCASCCTRKTPLWRDAEDGTPLCNACGIRYKKYRVRCLQCWNIPRKEASSNSKCLKCGDPLRPAAPNKRAAW